MPAADARPAPTKVPPPRCCVRVDQSVLDRFMPLDGGWRENTLPAPGGGLRHERRFGRALGPADTVIAFADGALGQCAR